MTLETIYQKQKIFFETNITKDYRYRLEKLKALKTGLEEFEEEILEALKLDLNKSKMEAYMTELGMVKRELNHIIKHLKKWMKPKKERVSIINFKSKGYISYEPLGISLIVSPWNYPVNLSLVPLIYSIAAGNCVILKVSSNSTHTAHVLKKLIDKYFSSDYIYLIFDKKETKEIFNLKYDHIFFTGGIETGKLFMKHASTCLCPVSLELGGKSPVIIDKNVDIDLTCKRIIFGKIINAGQTCVAPDYLLVARYNKSKIIQGLKKYLNEFSHDALQNDNYPKIINSKEFLRLVELLNEGNIIYGGKFDEKNLKIEPTLISLFNEKSPLMEEEIFGPILPIITYENLDDAIKIVNSNPKPLALYFFSNSKENKEKVLKEVSFGGGCFNDTLSHVSEANLPFGGVGNSGMGRYHGKSGFINFSNPRSILDKSFRLDLNLRYPPFTEEKYKKVKKFM